jgi:ubiquinone/menaquinone biosynthesis C-methylase UbiE
MDTHKPQWEDYYRTIRRLPSRFKKIAQFVVDVVSIFKDHNVHLVLDLGCGTGRHSVFLENKGFSVIGIDLSKSALKIARKWMQEGLAGTTLVQAAMTCLPFRNNSFDGMISISVINHAVSKDIKTTIDEIHRTLKKDGLIVANLTSIEDPRLGTGKKVEDNTFLIFEAFEQNQFEELHHFFTKNEVLELFTGFSETDVSFLRERPNYLKVFAKK